MAITKDAFIKKVTVIVDSREQENKHIIDYLNKFNIKYIVQKIDFGDYSFVVAEKGVTKDFRLSCVIERKSPNESFLQC